MTTDDSDSNQPVTDEAEIAESILETLDVPTRENWERENLAEHRWFLNEEAEFSHLIEVEGEDEFTVTFAATTAEFARMARRDTDDLIAVLAEPIEVFEDGVEKRVQYVVRTKKPEYAHTVARVAHEVCGRR